MPPKTTSRASKRMSAERKEALAEGRRRGRAVRAYLVSLERGGDARSDAADLQGKLEEVSALVDSEQDPARRVEHIQRRMDLEAALEAAGSGEDHGQLEAAFIEVAAAHSEAKALTWPAWREVGVPASVLREAGVPRVHRRRAS